MPSEAPVAAGSIAFGSMPPGVYTDPADCHHYHSLFAQIRYWAAYVGLQLELIQQRLTKMRFMAPGTEEWHISHADVHHRLLLLLSDMRRTKEYVVELGKVSMRYEYSTRLFALNQKLQAAHLQEECSQAESQEPTQTCRENLFPCKERSNHGIRHNGSQVEPAQSEGQSALQKVQLQRERWAQTRQSAEMTNASAIQHQGKQPKKGRFKQERQEEIQRSRQKRRQ